MLYYLGNPFVTILLTALTPTLAFSMLNLRFFSGRQVMLPLLAAGLSAGLLCIALRTAGVYAGFDIPAWGWCAVGLCNLYIWGERFFSEVLGKSKAARALVPGAAVVILAVSHLFSLAALNEVLLVVLVSSIFDGLRERKRPKENIWRPTDFKKNYGANHHSDIKLKSKPNIYLLLLESYHSADVLQRFYGIDDSKTDAVFKQNGFTLYENVFSNVPCTIPSLSTILTCDFIANPAQGNLALDTLRQNGYRAEFYDVSPYVFGALARSGEYTTFDYPDRVVRLYSLAGPLFAQSKFLRKIVKNIELFNTDICFSQIYSSLRARIRIRAGSPRIFCVRFGARHYDLSLPAWEPDAGAFVNIHRQSVEEAQVQIHDMIKLIKENDPKALVVAVGDHGAMRHNNIWLGTAATVGEMIQNRGVSLEEVALDMFAVRLAIYWPVPHKTSGVIISPINLFKYIFEALSGDQTLLEDLSPNISAIGEALVLVRDGKPLDKIQPFKNFYTMARRLEKIEAGTAGLEDYFVSGEYYSTRDFTKAVEILKKGHKLYPEDYDINMSLGRVLAAMKIKNSSLKYFAKGVRLSRFEPASVYEYMEFLWKFGQPAEAAALYERDPALSRSLKAAALALRAYYALEMIDEADNCAEKIIEQDPNVVLNALLWRNITSALAYFFERKEYARCNEGAQSLLLRAHNPLDPILLPVLIIRGLALIKQGGYQAAEQLFTKMCDDFNEPGAWSWILRARMQELNGNAAQAVYTLLTGAGTRPTYRYALMLHAGWTVQRSGLSAPEFERFKIISMKLHEFYKNTLRAKNVFSPTEDASAAMTNYLNNGMIIGSSPLPWFDPQLYVLLNLPVWHAGADPLGHFAAEPAHDFSLRRHTFAVWRPSRDSAVDFVNIVNGMNKLYATPGDRPELIRRTPATNTYGQAIGFQ